MGRSNEQWRELEVFLDHLQEGSKHGLGGPWVSPGLAVCRGLGDLGQLVCTSLSLSFLGFDWDLTPGFGQFTKMMTKGERHLCEDTQSRCSKMLKVEVDEGQ